MFATGAKPETVSGPETPTAEVPPKYGSNSGEEVVVGLEEMQYWKDLENNQISANVLKDIPRPKNKTVLKKMTREPLLNYIGFFLFF